MRFSFSLIILGLALAGSLSACDKIPGFSKSKNSDELAEIEQQLDELPTNGNNGSAQATENWYPNDITPPAGTQYPCALTALPKNLSGVPAEDRNYINHVYTMILRLTQSKLVLLQSFSQKADMPRVAAVYEQSNRKVYETISDEPTPERLADFQRAVLRAIDLHLQWSHEALYLLSHGGAFSSTMNFPSGKSASTELRKAWREMRMQYPEMSDAMSDSVEHHLCALDLF